ncbi:MAG: endolytic transglycosylase MltG [Flavobacteriales bacterium]|nr:endolytic transglycosylase MltG [Flavobacteriales bacterium]
MAKTKRRKSLITKIVLSVLAIIGIVGGFIVYDIYNRVYSPNVFIEGDDSGLFFIHTGANYDQVRDSLISHGLIKNENSFDWVAEKKGYKTRIKPGRYRLKDQMSNEDLVNLLRSGDQEPITLRFNNLRLKEDLAVVISEQLEADSMELIELLHEPDFVEQMGFSVQNVMCMFIPNTYEFYWNTDAAGFMQKMKKEYDKFWSKTRKSKAKKLGLTPKEVSILAAIVQKETSKNDEKPIVAGVYLNRLDKKMPLQADPTLIFALKDFSIKRVLNKHKKIDSPYNTYKNLGLPPGPITLPEVSSIDAVLNAEDHEYVYFCAKDDFSGYHNFAETYKQHLKNAKAWQKALNNKKIYK